AIEQWPAAVPRGAVACVPAAPRDAGQRLQRDPVGEEGGDLGVVVGRGHLHHVQPERGQLAGDPADRVEQRSPCATAWTRSPPSGSPRRSASARAWWITTSALTS